MNEVITQCPVCDHTQFAPFRRVQEWNLVQCRNCHLVLLSPRPSPEELVVLYEAPEYFAARIQREPSQETAVLRANSLRPVIQELTNRVGKPGRLLEIGCGYGFLLAAAHQSGWNVTGLEISPHAAGFARQTFGIPIIQDSAESLMKHSLGKFDAVILLSVIEHLYHPLPVLQMIRAHLAPQGVLWAVVPHVNSMDRYWHGDQWSGWDVPYHLWHFSPATATRLFHKAGFQQVQTENTFFNPIAHLRIGWQLKNLRADKRAWQLPGGAIAPAPAAPQPTTRPPAMFGRLLKKIFSERDMKIWAS